MIVNKLDACHCDSAKLVKKTLSQINRSEIREGITGAKMSMEKTWNKSIKVETIILETISQQKTRRTSILKFKKKIYVFLESSYQITTVEKLQKKNNVKLGKGKGTCRFIITKD